MLDLGMAIDRNHHAIKRIKYESWKDLLPIPNPLKVICLAQIAITVDYISGCGDPSQSSFLLKF